MFGIAVTLFATLLAGLMPTMSATRVSPASVMREGGRSRAATRTDARMRMGLVVAELALAVVLVTGAGLLLRSFVAMVSTEPGFRTEGALVFQVRLPEARYDEDAERSWAWSATRRNGGPPNPRAGGVHGLRAGAVQAHARRRASRRRPPRPRADVASGHARSRPRYPGSELPDARADRGCPGP